MKLSISVPDELWELAKIITREESPSAIVQNLITGELERLQEYQEYMKRRIELFNDLRRKMGEEAEE